MKIFNVWMRIDGPEGTLSYETYEAVNEISATVQAVRYLRGMGFTITTNEWDGRNDVVIERVEEETSEWAIQQFRARWIP